MATNSDMGKLRAKEEQVHNSLLRLNNSRTALTHLGAGNRPENSGEVFIFDRSW